MTNVTRFPGPSARRERQDLKEGRVRCEVSERWLQFPQCAAQVGSRAFLAIDVMTPGADGAGKKLCELVLTKEALLSMLDRITVQD